MEYIEWNRADMVVGDRHGEAKNAILHDKVVSYRRTGNRYEKKYVGQTRDGRVIFFDCEPTRHNYPRLGR